MLLAFAVSFALGYVVNFLLNFLMNTIAFWTLETFALQLIVRWVSDLLGGQIVPLIFFPGFLQKIVLALPFAAVYSTPLLIYVGTIPPASYAAAFASQLAWGGGFAVLATFMWARRPKARRRPRWLTPPMSSRAESRDSRNDGDCGCPSTPLGMT